MPQRIPGRYAGLLNELVGVSDALYYDGIRARARFKHEVPIDEFKLPIRQALFERAITSVGGVTAWKGYYDVHHVGWPYSAYRALSTDDFESVGEAYRNLGAVKVRVPRQLHEYFHEVFESPPVPDEEVMVQFMAEEAQIRKLLEVLNFTKLERLQKTIDPVRESGRHAQYLHILSGMSPPEVGHLPDASVLAALSIDDARTTLLDKVGILKYSA